MAIVIVGLVPPSIISAYSVRTGANSSRRRQHTSTHKRTKMWRHVKYKHTHAYLKADIVRGDRGLGAALDYLRKKSAVSAQKRQ